MSGLPDSRAAYLAVAKRHALLQLADGGPRAAIETMLEDLGRHPAWADGRMLALLRIELVTTLAPQGAGAVRAWIEGLE